MRVGWAVSLRCDRLPSMASPSVSVLMAVRNEERWLPAALDSLRAQTRTDFEVVAVDDGSTDGTTGILHGASHLPLTVVRAEGVGLGAARNLAIEAASAPVFAVLDGDDLWLPNYIELVVGRLEAEPEVAIACPELLFAVDEEITGERYYADGHPLRWFDDDQLLHLAEMNFIHSMCAFRREVVETVGGYDPTPGAMEDWDLWIRALEAGFRAAHIPEPCGVYRLRSGSITSNRSRLIRGRIGVLERLASIDGPAAARARASLNAQRLQLHIAEGKEALRAGDLAAARSSFTNVARHPDATGRQRVGSLVVAAFPHAGRFVLSRRSSIPEGTRSVEDLRRERE